MATVTMVTVVMAIAAMMTEVNRKLRHEYKHQITPAEDLVLSRKLEMLLKRDSHAGNDGSYTITSLYFDTPYDEALREKTAGINFREKFRLRYYGDDVTFIRLEKKYKINGLCGKKSAVLSKEDVEKLLMGDVSFLLSSDDGLKKEFYGKWNGKLLRPKVIVRYEREAFAYIPGNVRVTFDRNVRTALTNTDFLNPVCPFVSAGDATTILEVKYDAFLPEFIRNVIQLKDRSAAACSKYAICRRYE